MSLSEVSLDDEAVLCGSKQCVHMYLYHPRAVIICLLPQGSVVGRRQENPEGVYLTSWMFCPLRFRPLPRSRLGQNNQPDQRATFQSRPKPIGLGLSIEYPIYPPVHLYIALYSSLASLYYRRVSDPQSIRPRSRRQSAVKREATPCVDRIRAKRACAFPAKPISFGLLNPPFTSNDSEHQPQIDIFSTQPV